MNMRKIIGAAAVCGVFLFCISLQAAAVEKVPLADYLEYARAAADLTWGNYDKRIETWKQKLDPENVFGYRPPSGLLEMSVIYAQLYAQEENPEYLKKAKFILMNYDDFRQHFPKWAVEARPDYDDSPPALPDFFTVMRYIRTYDILKHHHSFHPEEQAEIESHIADSMTYLLRSQEWGPMNRAALRAESLAWAVRAVPDHPDRRKWEMQRKALGNDNWGNWEIEDASLYNAVWLYALCGYAHAMDKMEELFQTPEMAYYRHYFLHLMSPAGMIPDFGDAHWMSNWNRFLVYFETAANQYQDPRLKWAASLIARRFIDFSDPTNIGLAYMLLDCYLWGDDRLEIRKPQSLSKEVMEDIVGKKIVFRSGWEHDSTYMLLNYRDEGSGGLNFRDYLRDTIPVEEEKMTHGHADENSIVLFMSGGSVLLHDGGYRDFMPSGPFGAYRQDYFHNRLCVRPEKIFMGQQRGEYRYSIRDAVPGQNVIDFLRNAGSYRRVSTQKVDFLSFSDFDTSRTRLTDRKWGYQWDRVCTYIKDPELVIVFDIIKSLREEYFTMANLWHTRKILSRGNNWFDTVYDRIGAMTLPQNRRLLIIFPETHFRLHGFGEQERHNQPEKTIYQTGAQHFELGETTGFITVLIPHSPDVSPQDWLNKIQSVPVHPDRSGLGVRIQTSDGDILAAVKKDLRMDISRDWRRPRYTYEAGKISAGDITTNGDFIYARTYRNRLDYTIVNLTRALFKDQVLVDVKPSFFGLAFDASPDAGGRGKLRYWRDTVSLK
jgi:hypothetical protein